MRSLLFIYEGSQFRRRNQKSGLLSFYETGRKMENSRLEGRFPFRRRTRPTQMLCREPPEKQKNPGEALHTPS